MSLEQVLELDQLDKLHQSFIDWFVLFQEVTLPVSIYSFNRHPPPHTHPCQASIILSSVNKGSHCLHLENPRENSAYKYFFSYTCTAVSLTFYQPADATVKNMGFTLIKIHVHRGVFSMHSTVYARKVQCLRNLLDSNLFLFPKFAV